MKTQLTAKFEDIISVENLLEAWKEFIRGKRGKRDVQEFQLRLMDDIFSLHHDLTSRTYHHGGYHTFHIFDPKPREIHKASVRDRLLHHAMYRILYPFFDRTFIADSFSCRLGKGTHKALNRFRSFGYIVTKNDTKTCWVLKCDIRKFFANIDHAILLSILRKYILDAGILWLLEEVIGSFASATTNHDGHCEESSTKQSHIAASGLLRFARNDRKGNIGLPLGNLTSQLLVNIYMNEFDQFVKHKVKAKYYIRYADDFVIFSESREKLEEYIPSIRDFLQKELKLELHPQKLFIKTLASGVDFLGWVHFPDHRILRTTTRKRMMKKIAATKQPETAVSYLGLLKHGNTYTLRRRVVERI